MDEGEVEEDGLDVGDEGLEVVGLVEEDGVGI